MEVTPKRGLQGLVENWQSDLIAAVSVALIALPLSLGIALAAGAPAMAGIFSAIVGGVVTTLYRGGHISVNGPAKGVIAVILLGIALLDGDHAFIHDYYFTGLSLSTSLIFIFFLQKAPKALVVLSLSILSLFQLERGFYETRQIFENNIWKQCSQILNQNLLVNYDKVDSKFSPYPTIGLCLGKIQNAKSSKVYVEIQAGKIKARKKD